jgi:hypothetical protein
MTFKFPAGVLAQHIIALGKTGSGKSSKLRVLVEGLLARHARRVLQSQSLEQRLRKKLKQR